MPVGKCTFMQVPSESENPEVLESVGDLGSCELPNM